MQAQPRGDEAGMELNLGKLTPDRLSAVVDLDRQCFGQLWTAGQYERELDSPNSDLLILAPASTIERPHPPLLALGCNWAILDEAHIMVIAVHPDYQRRGLGRLMLAALLATAVNRGLERATLEVRIANEAAIGLYHQFGFEDVGVRRRYYADTGEDALIMWLDKLQNADRANSFNLCIGRVCQRVTQQGWTIAVTLEPESAINLPLT
jgi:[ribosomal protein S18]-alanine N-acetyltransferase